MFTYMRKIHQFFVNQLIYPIVLSSSLAVSIYIGRVLLSGNWLVYRNLVWNLFLAWIPYLFSVMAAVAYRLFPKSWWILLVPGALWLVFFPNAPYIVTDFLHLQKRPPIQIRDARQCFPAGYTTRNVRPDESAAKSFCAGFVGCAHGVQELWLYRHHLRPDVMGEAHGQASAGAVGSAFTSLSSSSSFSVNGLNP